MLRKNACDTKKKKNIKAPGLESQKYLELKEKKDCERKEGGHEKPNETPEETMSLVME